uniref:Adenylyl cyclase-associated protein 1 n=1 Tax=Canis lupus dingo TaxID=286419 RepID=A0A8C0KXD7_CANLU
MGANVQKLVERLERAVGPGATDPSLCHACGMETASKAGAAPCVQAFDAPPAGPVAECPEVSTGTGGCAGTSRRGPHSSEVGASPLGPSLSVCAADPRSDNLPGQEPRQQVVQSPVSCRREYPGPGVGGYGSQAWSLCERNEGAALFHADRVPKEYRDVGQKHVDWVKAYLSLWTELQASSKEFHTTGLAWGQTGPVAQELSGSPSGPSAGLGPPRPPPGPPTAVPTSAGSDESASHSALFAQINQGETSRVPRNVMGKVPTISINKTHGCHNSLDCEIVSAKSEMNVLIPTEGGDCNEFPGPYGMGRNFLYLSSLKLLLCSEKPSYLPSLRFGAGEQVS